MCCWRAEGSQRAAVSSVACTASPCQLLSSDSRVCFSRATQKRCALTRKQTQHLLRVPRACRCKGVDSHLPITVGMKQAMQDHTLTIVITVCLFTQLAPWSLQPGS